MGNQAADSRGRVVSRLDQQLQANPVGLIFLITGKRRQGPLLHGNFLAHQIRVAKGAGDIDGAGDGLAPRLDPAAGMTGQDMADLMGQNCRQLRLVVDQRQDAARHIQPVALQNGVGAGGVDDCNT